VAALATNGDLDGHEVTAHPSKPRPANSTAARRRPTPLVAPSALLALPVVIAVWIARRESGAPTVHGDPAPVEQVASPARPSSGPASIAGAHAIAANAGRAGGQGGAFDADLDTWHVPGAHPHPITEQHQRIFRENALIGAMDGAMDVNDGAGLQSLLVRYREEYPDDPNLLQEGYQAIANCLLHPGAGSSALGRQYVDRERGSILRRFVERHCLGQ
jgi:hypothetical protein